MGGEWFILLTSGGKTLALADELDRRGIEAWAPRMSRMVRVPRANVRRKIEYPLLPRFVFVRAVHLAQAAELAARQGFRPGFRVFRWEGAIPLVREADLAPLRRFERRVPPVAPQRKFRAGETVRIVDGSFGGMAGTVVECSGRYIVVHFAQGRPVKIPVSMLDDAPGPDAMNVGSGMDEAA